MVIVVSVLSVLPCGKGRVLPPGNGICSDWTPSHAASRGTTLNVPLDLTFTALHPPNHPWYCFCQTFMCRQPSPMVSNLSPYSLCLQVLRLSRNGPPGHVMPDEWFIP